MISLHVISPAVLGAWMGAGMGWSEGRGGDGEVDEGGEGSSGEGGGEVGATLLCGGCWRIDGWFRE